MSEAIEIIHQTDQLRCLIGGSPCGGTHFVSSLLTALGLICTHESIGVIDGQLFHHRNNESEQEWSQVRAVCSWTTEEYFHHDLVKSVPVILILRNPFRILNSLLSVSIDMGEVFDIGRIMESIRHRFERYELSGRIVKSFRVEDQCDELCEYLGLSGSPPELARFSKNRGRINLKWADIKHFAGAEHFLAFAADRQYEPL